uniref:Uncharacterized protein n=1 Tax=Panagrolaimus sp. JU765 TaxID=591449 RepID=A0AC34R291_9BILA
MISEVVFSGVVSRTGVTCSGEASSGSDRVLCCPGEVAVREVTVLERCVDPALKSGEVADCEVAVRGLCVDPVFKSNDEIVD